MSQQEPLGKLRFLEYPTQGLICIREDIEIAEANEFLNWAKGILTQMIGKKAMNNLPSSPTTSTPIGVAVRSILAGPSPQEGGPQPYDYGPYSRGGGRGGRGGFRRSFGGRDRREDGGSGGYGGYGGGGYGGGGYGSGGGGYGGRPSFAEPAPFTKPYETGPAPAPAAAPSAAYGGCSVTSQPEPSYGGCASSPGEAPADAAPAPSPSKMPAPEDDLMPWMPKATMKLDPGSVYNLDDD